MLIWVNSWTEMSHVYPKFWVSAADPEALWAFIEQYESQVGLKMWMGQNQNVAVCDIMSGDSGSSYPQALWYYAEDLTCFLFV